MSKKILISILLLISVPILLWLLLSGRSSTDLETAKIKDGTEGPDGWDGGSFFSGF